jgi:DNA-binding GntR family transcriptional regulator
MTLTRVININENAGGLADQAYDKIKSDIFNFDLMPGDLLSESELAQQINVSRTPLRQALQRLQHEGFVEAIPKVGWLIPALNFQTFDELYDFRMLIECFVIRELCITVENRSEFRNLANIWQVSSKERLRDPVKVSALDEAFHMQIVESKGNGEILRAYREITERIRIIRRLDFTKPDRVLATYDEHAKILSAIQRRRAGEAQRLLRAHIEMSKREVRKITLGMLDQARNSGRAKRKQATPRVRRG